MQRYMQKWTFAVLGQSVDAKATGAEFDPEWTFANWDWPR
jgi:hypothetical protein